MKKIEENIVLVPTDFTKVADIATDHAAGIAKLLNGKVVLLHVINKETKSYLKKENLTEDAINDKLVEVAKAVEKKHNVKLDYMAVEGSIFTTIAEVTKDVNAKIVVMGTHGKVGVQHLVGSFALKVIESSPVPVIVVQEKDFNNGYKHIVLPVDETSESKQKLKWAIHIAKIFDSTIHLYGAKHNDEFLADEVNKSMSQLKSILTKNNVNFTVKTSTDPHHSFSKSIVAYGDAINADMIMIMTNPDQLMPSFILSPWAEHVIFNTSNIPVMCINPVELDIYHVSF